MKTITLIRDTQSSFIATTTNEQGQSFTRKHEKGFAGYADACAKFQRANTPIVIGAQVTYTLN